MSKEEIFTGDDVWNISKGYVNLRILRAMLECDRFRMIAIYGTEDMMEIIPKEMKAVKRVEGIQRYKDTLKGIFLFTAFVIKKGDRDKFQKLRERLIELEKNMLPISKTTSNHLNHQHKVTINERFFSICLQQLSEIEEELNIYLNNANLIFRQSDDFDLDDIIEQIATRG